MITMLQWQGGIRTFDAAMRLGTTPLNPEAIDTTRSLAAWGRVLELSTEARVMGGQPFSQDYATIEKQRVSLILPHPLALQDCSIRYIFQGNVHFGAGEYLESIVAFEAASIINPTDVTFYTNAAAARIKLCTPEQ